MGDEWKAMDIKYTVDVSFDVHQEASVLKIPSGEGILHKVSFQSASALSHAPGGEEDGVEEEGR